MDGKCDGEGCGKVSQAEGRQTGRVEGSLFVGSFHEVKAGGGGEMRTASIDFHQCVFPSMFFVPFFFPGILTTTFLSNLFVFDPVFQICGF